jgi:hypothetical protein
VLRELERGALGEGDDPALARRVVGLAEIAGLADERADVDDASEALRDHHRRRGGEAVIDAVQVRVDDVQPVAVRHLAQRPVAGDAGVVDEDIEPSARLDHTTHHGARLLDVAHVGLHEHAPAAEALDLRRDGRGVAIVGAVVDRDLRALASEREPDCPADAARGARDGRHLSFQPVHVWTPDLGAMGRRSRSAPIAPGMVDGKPAQCAIHAWVPVSRRAHGAAAQLCREYRGRVILPVLPCFGASGVRSRVLLVTRATALLAFCVCGAAASWATHDSAGGEELSAWTDLALRSASAAAAEVTEARARAHAHASIAAAMPEPRHATERERALTLALQAARTIDHPAVRDLALQDVVRAQSPDFRAALATAREIGDEATRTGALTDLVRARIAVHDVAGAVVAAQLVSGAVRAGTVWREIAAAQARAADTEAALTTARRITDIRAFELALGEIAAAVAAAGDYGYAASLLGQVRDRSRRDEGLSRVAIARASRGDGWGAAETARSIRDPGAAARAWSRLGSFHFDAGEAVAGREGFRAALDAARRMRDPEARAAAFRDIASDQIRSGESTAARESLGEAERAAAKIRRATTAASFRESLARMRARAGDLDAALRTARELRDPLAQALLVRDIAAIQAVRGDGSGAAATVAAFADPAVRAIGMLSIADAQSREKEQTIEPLLRAAAAATESVAAAELRGQLLCALAAAYLREGRADEARRLLEAALATIAAMPEADARAAAYVEAARALRAR